MKRSMTTTMNKLCSKIFKKYQNIIIKKLCLLIYKIKSNTFMEIISRVLPILTFIFQMISSMRLFKFKKRLYWKFKLKLRILKNLNWSTISYMMHCLNGWKHFLVFRICSGSFMMKKRKNILRITFKFYKTCQNNMNNMKAFQKMKILE